MTTNRLRDQKLPFWFYMDGGPPRPISPPPPFPPPPVPEEKPKSPPPPPPPPPQQPHLVGLNRGRGRGIMGGAAPLLSAPGGPAPLTSGLKDKIRRLLWDFPQCGLTMTQLKDRWGVCYPGEKLATEELFKMSDFLEIVPVPGQSEFFIKLRHPPPAKEASTAFEEFGSWEKDLDDIPPTKERCDPLPEVDHLPKKLINSTAARMKQSLAKRKVDLKRGIFPLMEAPPFSKSKLPSAKSVSPDVWEGVFSILFYYGKAPDWLRLDTLCAIYASTFKGLPDEFSSGNRGSFFSCLQEWVRFSPDPTGSFCVQLREEPASVKEIIPPVIFDLKQPKVVLRKHKYRLVAEDADEEEEWQEDLETFSKEFVSAFPPHKNPKLGQFKAELYWLILNHFPKGLDSSQVRQAYNLKYQRRIPEEFNSRNMEDLLESHCSDVLIFNRKSAVHGMVSARLDLPLRLDSGLLGRMDLLEEYRHYQTAPTAPSTERRTEEKPPRVIPLPNSELNPQPSEERRPPPEDFRMIPLKGFQNRPCSKDALGENSTENSSSSRRQTVATKINGKKNPLQWLTEEERLKLSDGYRILRLYARNNRGGIWLMDFPSVYQLEQMKRGLEASFDLRLLRLLAAEAKETSDFALTYNQAEGEFGILVQMKQK